MITLRINLVGIIVYIVIDGIKEESRESWEQTKEKVRQSISSNLRPLKASRKTKIECAHCAGSASKKDDSRSIVVKFTHFNDNDFVVQKAREIRPKGLLLMRTSTRVFEKRKELLPRMKEERAEGKITYLSNDKLFVKDRHKT